MARTEIFRIHPIQGSRRAARICLISSTILIAFATTLLYSAGLYVFGGRASTTTGEFVLLFTMAASFPIAVLALFWPRGAAVAAWACVVYYLAYLLHQDGTWREAIADLPGLTLQIWPQILVAVLLTAVAIAEAKVTRSRVPLVDVL